MNFAEELVYWYLRLNGFFPITDFVLHHEENHRTSDADIVAVRFPYVFEAIGGQSDDWDRRFAQTWGIDLTKETVGLIVEVKSGQWNANALMTRQWRVCKGLRRMGMLPDNDVLNGALAMLEGNAVARADQYTFAKLLVCKGPVPPELPWLHIPLDDIDTFIVNRMRRYHAQKYSDRLFFSGELIQYLAWKSNPPTE